ncbi:Gpr1 family protein [Russula emetica]|nr:Gpr1 family protein [Russula emetica]
MSDIEKLISPQRRTQIANPAPLGLFAFASTTLVLSLFNVQARHVAVPNLIVGMALFYGGLAQLLAGMWEFVAGNTFGATAFTSYGAFWLSFATLFIPGSGIGSAYAAVAATAPDMEDNAIGIFLMAWMVVTFLFFIGSLRKSVGLSALFFMLTTTFFILGVGFLNQKVNIIKIGGFFGIATALIAYYCGLAEMLTENDIFTLPTGKH